MRETQYLGTRVDVRSKKQCLLWGPLWVWVFALLLMGCAAQMRYHGYAPSDAELAQIEVGRDTQDTVVEKLGRPSTTGVRDDSVWIWVQSDWRHEHWRAPVEVNRAVVAISFDAAGRVANIERFGLEDGQVVVLSRRVTDSGPRPTLLSQIFRVFGRFTAADFVGE